MLDPATAEILRGHRRAQRSPPVWRLAAPADAGVVDGPLASSWLQPEALREVGPEARDADTTADRL